MLSSPPPSRCWGPISCGSPAQAAPAQSSPPAPAWLRTNASSSPMAVPRSQSATPVFPTTLTSSSLAVHTIVAPMARLLSPALALDVPLGPLGKRSDSVSIDKVVNWWCMGVDSILRASTSLKLPVQAGRDSHHVLWVLLKWHVLNWNAYVFESVWEPYYLVWFCATRSRQWAELWHQHSLER